MNGRAWTEEELFLVREAYPTSPTTDIAVQLGRNTRQVYQAAMRMGLKKSADYLAGCTCGRLQKGKTPAKSVAHRFRPGQVPHNKGLRRPGYAPGRMSEGQFSKGQLPHNTLPLGSERISKDGYVQRKVSETRIACQDWKFIHILVWEEANGPVPAGHAVVFKDGDRHNTALSNLELITRRELMRRNSVHRLPKELAEVIQLRGALKRQIGKHTRAQEQTH